MRRVAMWLAGGFALAAAVTAGTSTVVSAAPQPSTPTAAGLAATLNAAQPPTAPSGHLQPLWRTPQPAQGVTPHLGEPGGYDPDELRAYLGLHGTGQGETVAIVEAWDVSVAVPHALDVYDSFYGLKPACSDTVTSGCFHLTFPAPDGTRTPATIDENDRYASFQQEAELDVSVVHALLPDADITVVEGSDDSEGALMSAIDYAASLHPAVISNSYGDQESAGEQALDGHCQATGVPCVFSSGDAGNPGGYPAANPNVLAVGGTTLDMGPTGEVRSESGWEGSGGGVSPFEPQPAYQDAMDPFPGGRGVPDVSFDADPFTGVSIYAFADVLGFQIEEWSELGGTSVGAPAWSAILTAADQLRAAAGKPPLTADGVHAALYAKSAKGLADITTGGNGLCATCFAARGYDLVTGQGSPRPGIDTFLARH